MSEKGKRYRECPTCHTLIAYLNGVCPECGGSGVVEVRELPPVPMIPPQVRRDPKSTQEQRGDQDRHLQTFPPPGPLFKSVG
jgi:hypothetical protein